MSFVVTLSLYSAKTLNYFLVLLKLRITCLVNHPIIHLLSVIFVSLELNHFYVSKTHNHFVLVKLIIILLLSKLTITIFVIHFPCINTSFFVLLKLRTRACYLTCSHFPLLLLKFTIIFCRTLSHFF